MGWWTYIMCLFLVIGLQIGLLSSAETDLICDPNTEFSCRNDPTLCISLSRVRDGSPDCPDKSDEECIAATEFQCQSIHQCIPKERFHDGWPDCDDGSDEECGKGQHRCLCGLPHCVDGHKVKDGVKDCEDGSDEDLRNKTKPCPEESRLQDLMAVEKRRKKRQIHQIQPEEKRLDDDIGYVKAIVTEQQPLPSSESKNSFEYSYTKFALNRQHSAEYHPKLNHAARPSVDILKTVTETEMYGSLNSGKIYQTAVNEAVSVFPSAEYTVIKFDNPKDKVDWKSYTKDKLKMHTAQNEEKRFSDLFQKMALLFQNNSSPTNMKNKAFSYLNKNKSVQSDSTFKHRKLLALSEEEESFPDNLKRMTEDSNTNNPLLLESSQADMNRFSTGLLQSTTGIDVIDGRTTEWTTLIEGTIIDGRYAHIIHSTSKIFFTVDTDTSDMNTEIPIATNTIPDISIDVSSTPVLEITSVVSPESALDGSHELSSEDSQMFADSMAIQTSKTVIAESSTRLTDNIFVPMFDEENSSDLPSPLTPFLLQPTSVLAGNDKVDVLLIEGTELTNSDHTSSLEMNVLLSPSVLNDIETTNKDVKDENLESIMSQVLPLTTSNENQYSEKTETVSNDLLPSLVDSFTPSIALSIWREGLLMPSITEKDSNQHNAEAKSIDINFDPSLIYKDLIDSTPELISDSLNTISSSEFSVNTNDDLEINPISSSLFIVQETSIKNANVLKTTEDYLISHILKSTNPSNPQLWLLSSKDEVINSHIVSSILPDTDKEIKIPEISSSITLEKDSIAPDAQNDIGLTGKRDGIDITLSESFYMTTDAFMQTIKPQEESVTIKLPTFNLENDSANKNDRIFLLPSTDVTDFTSYIELSPPSPTEASSLYESDTSGINYSGFSDIDNTNAFNHDNIKLNETPTITEDHLNRKKRATSDSVTILRPDGRIISTDARVYLTPTTHYTTYTYFTTILKPGGGTRIQSNLHVDTVVMYPDELAAPHTHYDDREPCCGGDIIHSTVYDDYDRHGSYPSRGNGYHVDTVPYDISRASDITHRTTFTYYTTRFRGGTSYVETRKETETNVTPIPTYLRGSSTYYQPHEIPHYHTEAPYVRGATDRRTYTHYATRIRGGTPVVFTRLEVETNITPVLGHVPVATRRHSDPVVFDSPNRHIHRHNTLPDRPSDITHRTTYTYHTTRFRDGTPIVNTRKETDTNVTPIPTYYRPHIRTDNVYVRPSRTGIPHRAVTRTHIVRPVDYDPHTRYANDPYITDRTTHTYYTTYLRGGTPHVSTNYVTKTQLIRNSAANYDRRSLYDSHDHHHHHDDYDGDCPVCAQSIRQASTRYIPIQRTRARANEDHSASDHFDPSILPSTATQYSTYTYATTLLNRDDRPSVRTREHTVTEILSDVVLPTLSGVSGSQRELTFGERIRAKRTVQVQDDTPTVVVATAGQSSAFDNSRQGRRIPFRNGRTRNNNVPRNHQSRVRTFDKPPTAVIYSAGAISPSAVTFYSTYTYFTTELSDGKPVIKSREHTVTEILTDVIVPTVSLVGNRHLTSREPISHGRRVRNANTQPLVDGVNLKESFFQGKLLSAIESSDKNLETPTSISTPPLQRFPEMTSDVVLSTPTFKDKLVTTNALLDTSSDLSDINPETREKRDVDDKDSRAKPKASLHSTSDTTHIDVIKEDAQVYGTRYRPTFANRIRRPFYDSNSPSAGIRQSCPNCNSQPGFDNHPNKRKVYVRKRVLNRNANLNRVPADRIQGQRRIRPQKTANAVVHTDIKPSRVTYFSTYTYFTTELVDGSPVVKSREHTVTEILTDVIVPTVVPANPSHQRHYRGKRYVFNSYQDSDSNKYEVENMSMESLLSDGIVHTPSSKYYTDSSSSINILPSISKRKILQVSDDETDETIALVLLSNAEFDNEKEIENIEKVKPSSTLKLESNTLKSSLKSAEITSKVIAINNDEFTIINFFNNTESSDDCFSCSENNLNFSSKTLTPTEISNQMSLQKILNSNDSSETQISPTLIKDVSISDIPDSAEESKKMVSVVTSSVRRNGRTTKYTTTIYGTYINGVYAQRAESNSNVMSATASSIEAFPTTLMFSPSRQSGLVKSLISKKIRGPVAVHVTTEIHGMFVNGAYAQTARIFTSSQPLSTTRESLKHKLIHFPPSTTQGVRKTGLLSSRILRSKIEGDKTLLFVSEIYGTHIGGAYAHLGKYTTRTIPEPSIHITSLMPLKTLYAADLTTGLITASVSDKFINGTTSRYHYEVYGTYLDGTYAHVPSISTEIILPQATAPLFSYTFLNEQNILSSQNNQGRLKPSIFSNFETTTKAKSRVPEETNTNTHKVFEIYDTYLEKDFHPSPSASVEILENIKIEDIETDRKPNINDGDFEILTIFMSPPSPKIFNTRIIDRSSEKSSLNNDYDAYKIGLKPRLKSPNKSSTQPEKLPKKGDESYHSIHSVNPPSLLPEVLRLSPLSENRNLRLKRESDPSAQLQGSFALNFKKFTESHKDFLTVTTPLPEMEFEPFSSDDISKNTDFVISKSHTPKTKKTKKSFYQSKHGVYIEKEPIKTLGEDLTKHLKRVPRSTRQTFGSKRFGASSASRKFSPSNTFKLKTSTAQLSNRGFRSSSPLYSSSQQYSNYNVPSKSVPNFLLRNQRSKQSSRSSKFTTDLSKTSTPSLDIVQSSTRPRKFGKLSTARVGGRNSKVDETISKVDEDFDASEAIPRSITSSRNRILRPSKRPKLIPFPTTTSRSLKYSSTIQPIAKQSRRHRNMNKLASSSEQKTTEDYLEPTSVRKRFTLTTSTFSININPTAGFPQEFDTEENNNLQEESPNRVLKVKNKNRLSAGNRQKGAGYGSFYNNGENEVMADKPKSLPLPPFGRSRGLRRPPQFDPRTIKSTSTQTASIITYTSPSFSAYFDDNDTYITSSPNSVVTVTDIFTTVKTLPVHLGIRTSFATLTTTAYSTSTIRQEDLTTITVGDVTKTLLSAITKLPDANNPYDRKHTVVTEIIVTTTEIESSSLVAIKIGFGTRTDTLVAKQIFTTLLTQTNTVIEQPSATLEPQNPFPYFPNPFAPVLQHQLQPRQTNEFSLSLTENSFISTQTVTSTTVLPLFFNGKTVLTTLTSTSLNEATLVKTTTVKVPQVPTAHPFVFPQPVFILPSITTEITVHFTAGNGEVMSIVTLVTVPLALNSHSRFARSAFDINPSQSVSYETQTTSSHIDATTDTVNSDYYLDSLQRDKINLQSSFDAFTEQNRASVHTATQSISESVDFNPNYNSKAHSIPSYTNSFSVLGDESQTPEKLESDNFYEQNEVFRVRKLLQFSDELSTSDDIVDDTVSNGQENSKLQAASFGDTSSTQGDDTITDDAVLDMYDLPNPAGPDSSDDESDRPIPSVRVIPTRRAYIRRIKPASPPNRSPDAARDDYNVVPNQPSFSSRRPNFPQDDNNYGIIRNVPSYSPTRQNPPQNFAGDGYGIVRNPSGYETVRTDVPLGNTRNDYRNVSPYNSPARPLQEGPVNNYGRIRNYQPIRSNAPPGYSSDGYDAVQNLPSYSPTRQTNPVPSREESVYPPNQVGNDGSRLQGNRGASPSDANPPRRFIRLRRPTAPTVAQPEKELLDRKPIVNTVSNDQYVPLRARGPAIVTNTDVIPDARDTNQLSKDNSISESKPQGAALPLTYYTTFTYLTTFLNGPSTAYSTREAVVSNVATETLNPRIVELIRARGGFTQHNGAQTAVPLGSRAQGASTTIVNLASRVQLYNSDVYYSKVGMMPFVNDEEPLKTHIVSSTFRVRGPQRTVSITEVATLPKTYYTLFTYYYTLNDGDKSTFSQRSETISNVDSQTEPFIRQNFASTIDNSGFLTLYPEKEAVNLGLRTTGGTTTEVNLELKTLVHFDGLKNIAIDRGSITPTLVEIAPTETSLILDNYLEPDDAEVQDQQTYPQTVPIQPSFASGSNAITRSRGAPRNSEATPEIPQSRRIIRTQSIRGPLRIASTVRPGSLRSGVFAPRPGVRVRVRPASTRSNILDADDTKESDLDDSSPSETRFESPRSRYPDEPEDDEAYDDEEDSDLEEDEVEEEDISDVEEKSSKETVPERKRLKITIRRSPGVGITRTSSRFVIPSRTRPRFYVVTRTGSPAGSSVRTQNRPVSVKVSRKLRPSEEPQYETYTTMTSVPVVFGLSTTYRNAIVTSSSLLTSSQLPTKPSKTVVLTYFTTTTYTVPYTVNGRATYTTLEETNSRVATETLDADAELPYTPTPSLERSSTNLNPGQDGKQTLSPQVVNDQMNVNDRVNLVTKVSNGVTLIVATDGTAEATHVYTQPTLTLQPTMVTDALLMVNKDVVTTFEPRTFYTTFTFFTTLFSSGTPTTSTSEQVVTNVYSVPVVHSISKTKHSREPFTVIETSKAIVPSTVYSTHTFYATLFNGSESFVTPIEEIQSSVVHSTETFTITKTIVPDYAPDATETTTSVYRTVTNYVTLFRGSESIVSPLEEVVTDIVTLTLDRDQATPKPDALFTTRTIQATSTHYITLFSGSQSILSSITEVAPSVITELVKQLQEPSMTPYMHPISSPRLPEISASSEEVNVEPTYQDLVPSVRTEYTTLTYFTTLFNDSSTIKSSREEVATSYITLFVPAPLAGVTRQSSPLQTSKQTNQYQIKPTDQLSALLSPTSEVLTFYTTYTYYTTLFRGSETIISDSETVVTQYVTISSTPSEGVSQFSTSNPPTFTRPSAQDPFEIRIEPTSSSSFPSQGVTSGETFATASYGNDNAGNEGQILGVSTKIGSAGDTPSILTGIPSTDANGATHILFTDFIVPSIAFDSSSQEIIPSLRETPSLPESVRATQHNGFHETTFFPMDSSRDSSARDTPSDLATTRLTDVNVATQHIPMRPTSTYQSGSSSTLGIKPGAVIDLSDVLTNTNLVGNLGETIKDIVNLFAANGNRAKNNSSKTAQSTTEQISKPSGGITVSSAEDPVFIPIGAIGRSTTSTRETQMQSDGAAIQPSTMLSGFLPVLNSDGKYTFNGAPNRGRETIKISKATGPMTIFGSDIIFIQPTKISAETPETLQFSIVSSGSSFQPSILQGSVARNDVSDHLQATPGFSNNDSTTLITGLETIFFELPDGRHTPHLFTGNMQGSVSTSSVVGIETIFFDSPGNFFIPGGNRISTSGATTIFSSFPTVYGSTRSSEATPVSSFTSSSSGETTIFFPVPDADQQQSSPGTRYVTSVESVTLTLTLTTSTVYHTQETPVTVTSVFTTTIPPRTFVSTIIGSRTILGAQPEPTEAVQVIPPMQASESTTTVTTTTLIFNSIATTVVRTLVIPTQALQPTRASTSTDTAGSSTTAVEPPRLENVAVPPNQRPKVTTTGRPTTTRKPIQLFKSGNRPTDPTTQRPARTGPPLKLFPTKPPTTTTKEPPPVTTRKSTFRKPGKTLVPITDGCTRECNLKNKEVCKQNTDKTWSCQCRPGFFKKVGSEECKDVKSFVVLVRVLKMDGNDVKFNPELNNYLSPEYKSLTTTARKAVDDAYKTSSVGDDYVSANVLSVSEGSGVRREGVLVNLTVQLSGEKAANEELLREELIQSLDASASEIDFTNASVVSPIIQRVEDVQDFDECADDNYNDCSRSSVCVNLPGSYTCECRDGYQDLEPLLPGRICSGEIKDCDYCNNRGVCIMTEDDNKFCRCYRMYLGKQCEINGLVLAIALPIALALLILTMFFLMCCCRKLRRRRAQKPKPNVFKGMVPPMAGTLDRKAMIMDSSSESSGEHRPPAQTPYEGFSEEGPNSTMKRSRRSISMDDHLSAEFQVPTVLIPRAKHSHPKQMLFGRNGSCQDIRIPYPLIPGRRMSTQSLICDPPSSYPSTHKRQGSLCPLDKLSYDDRLTQLSDLRANRLPPPAPVERRRRMSGCSSRAYSSFHSGPEYLSNRFNSAMRHSYGLEPELWQPGGRATREMSDSLSHLDLMREVSMAPSSTNTRRRNWSDSGRSCDETTIQASMRRFRSGSDYVYPGSRQSSTRKVASEAPTLTDKEDLDLSFTDSLMPISTTPSYEKHRASKKSKRRNSKAYSSYDNPAASLRDEFNDL